MTETEWLASTDVQAMYVFLRDTTTLFRTRWQGYRAVPHFAFSERKSRLFAVACCRRILHLMPTDEARACVVAAEHYADGLIDARDLSMAVQASMHSCERDLSRYYSTSANSNPAVRRAALKALERVHRPEGARAVANDSAHAWAAAKLEEAEEAERAEAVAAADFDDVLSKLAGAAEQDEADDEDDQYVSSHRYIELSDEQFDALRVVEQARQADLLRDIVGNPFQPAAFDPSCLAWNDRCVERLARGIYEDRAFERLPILHDALLDAGCDNECLLAHCRSPEGHVRGCWVVDLLLAKE